MKDKSIKTTAEWYDERESEIKKEIIKALNDRKELDLDLVFHYNELVKGWLCRG